MGRFDHGRIALISEKTRRTMSIHSRGRTTEIKDLHRESIRQGFGVPVVGKVFDLSRI
jgi:hypothetical protein